MADENVPEEDWAIYARENAVQLLRERDDRIKVLRVNLGKLNHRCRCLQEERDSLKAALAAHDLCHDLHGRVGPREFADGCAAEQRRLYGCAPDADEVERLKKEAFRETVISKPGAVLEVRSIEIPERIQKAISDAVEQGKKEAGR